MHLSSTVTFLASSFAAITIWLFPSPTKNQSHNVNDTENKFLVAINDTFLYQHVCTPTRIRHDNNPSILDLIFTNEPGMVSDIETSSCLGKLIIYA